MKEFQKTPRMLEVERYLGENIEDYLRRRFVDDNVSVHIIAKETGVAYRNILNWLKVAGIYSRRLGICQQTIQK